MKRRRTFALALVASLAWSLAACDAGTAPAPRSGPSAEAGSDVGPDARVLVHAYAPSTPTSEGLVYIEAVAEIHERADAAETDAARAELLAEGLKLERPAGVPEAEVLELELAARLCETRLALGQAEAARELLETMLPPQRSLPLDRASAHALTVLGDAARASGDDALAAGSYGRSVRVMGLIADELAERAGVDREGAP